MDPLDKPYTTSCGHTWTMRHTACPECFAALREENARLRWVVKGAHGALTDAATVVVPGVLDGDLKPAIRQITRERDEARQQLTCIDLWLRRREPVTHESATLRSVQEFIVRAEAEVARLEGLILDWWTAPESRLADAAAALCLEGRRIRDGGGQRPSGRAWDTPRANHQFIRSVAGNWCGRPTDDGDGHCGLSEESHPTLGTEDVTARASASIVLGESVGVPPAGPGQAVLSPNEARRIREGRG